MPAQQKITWNSRLGAVLAVAGSAVGFGNFLRFPGLAAQYGGGSFMIAYFLAFVFLGIPLCWAEWAIGRRAGVLGGHSTASAVMLISRSPFWKYLGVLGVVVPLCISMYYMYLEGWTLGYCYNTAAGNLKLGSSAEFASFFSNFSGAGHDGAVYSPGNSGLLYFYIFAVLANLYLIYRGITKGIEWFSKWSIPVLLLTSLLVLVRVLTLGTPDAAHPERNINEGLGYMWNPAKTVLQVEGRTVDMLPAHATAPQAEAYVARVQAEHPGVVVETKHISLLEGLMSPELWITAAGQIFLSLSVGFGILACYSSYVGRGRDIALSSLTANAANEVVEVGIAGMMIVPAAVSLLGVAAAAGASTFGLGFTVLPEVFAAMPGGRLFGALFFGLLSLAALTSSISIIQPAIAFAEEFWNLSRTQSVVLMGTLLITGSFIVSWYTGDGMVALGAFDFWAGTMGIYLTATVYMVFFRFVWGTRNGLRELGRGALIPLPRGLGFTINWITPAILLAIFASWLYQNVFGETSEHITNILEGKPGAVLPMAMMIATAIFMAFVIRTSRHFHYRKLEEQKERIPYS